MSKRISKITQADGLCLSFHSATRVMTTILVNPAATNASIQALLQRQELEAGIKDRAASKTKQ
jgi:hypothetical protein